MKFIVLFSFFKLKVIIKLIIFIFFFGILFLIYDNYRYKFYNTENSISVLTYNCGNQGKQQPSLEQIAEVIEYAGKPDIVFLQDITWPVKTPDICKLLNYPYYVTARKKPTPFANIAIISKYPLSEDEKLSFNPGRKPRLLSAVVTINKIKTLLCCVKLSSLSKDIVNRDESISLVKVGKVLYKEIFYKTEHTKEVAIIIDYIKTKKMEHVIIGGDFNTISLSKPIRVITKSYKDSFRYSIKQFKGTRIKYFIKP
ncbi:MAG: hypothetical protein PF503_03315, partial [Desulfobacula sp.]|nr:hypothetical protein [Desulfobacula sp.]